MNHSEARERRMSLNLTQDAVASAIGVSRGSLAHFEAGTRSLSPETLRALSLVLNEPTLKLPSIAPEEPQPSKPRPKRKKKAPSKPLTPATFTQSTSPVLTAFAALEEAIRQDERQKCLQQLQFDILGSN